MGVTNLFCFISGKNLQEKESSLVLPLKKVKTNYLDNEFSTYEALTLPILGPYDEYGFVELTSLKHLPIQVEAINSQFKDKDYTLKLNSQPNHMWSAVIDKHIPYLIMSYKMYSSIEKLVNPREITKLRKQIVEIRNNNKDMNISLKKEDPHYELIKSIKDLKNGILTDYPLSSLCRGPEVFLQYKELEKYIEQGYDEEIVLFYCFCKVMNDLGRKFFPSGYGRQEDNKNFVKKYHELIIENLKGKK